MKYEINARHVEIMNKLFDLTLKNVGMNGVNAVTNLITILGTVQPNPTVIIELDENQIKQINSMLDISLKAQGLNSLGLTLELSGFLNNPLVEEESEEQNKE